MVFSPCQATDRSVRKSMQQCSKCDCLEEKGSGDAIGESKGFKMEKWILRIYVISPPSFLRITLLLCLEDFNRVNSKVFFFFFFLFLLDLMNHDM